MNKVKDKIDKKLLLLGMGISILFLIFFCSYMINAQKRDKYFDITRLSQEYLKNQHEDGKIEASDVKRITSDISENSKIEDGKTIDISNDKVVEKISMEIENLINTNQFDKLLKMYNQDYVRYFNVNKELLYDKFKFADTVIAKVTKIKRDRNFKDRAVVNIRFIDENNAERMFDFTIYKDGTITDLAFYEEVDVKNRIKEKDDIIYTFKKKYVTRLGSIYVLNIKNNSEFMLNIQDIKGVLGTSLEYNHELINGNKFTYQITPKEDITMAFKICNQEKPDDIIITNEKMDGTIEQFGIWKKEKK